MAIVPAARSAAASFAELSTYTPMRLTLPERRLFRLLEAALTVCDYTDKVDILKWNRGNGRIVQQVKDICSILSGLVVAQVRFRHSHVQNCGMLVMVCGARRTGSMPSAVPVTAGQTFEVSLQESQLSQSHTHCRMMQCVRIWNRL